ncbi:39 kDa initiator binding protein [Tritrichomonas foetus]|uniref:39 kDa initiator binding protein n=1 Tax=Tritrichomonas foetus TaxID=1144522 RepID=A0A1J4JX46_9EUKA|nr:39 kDa initiator binding protein [Tritrichomonas foetus]|eukprot:OHT03571.1 39 kDa initiator binding protein [Tritrichomonas foetus]
MSNDLALNPDVIASLPAGIKVILGRKSSRDPESRFTSKLHILLSFVSENPGREDDLGVAWVTEDEFKLNKRILAAVMGIKLNTLNVNLKDLHFQQQQHNKDGWTRWRKVGFTRSQISDSQQIPQSRKKIMRETATFNLPFSLGPLVDSFFQEFQRTCVHTWKELTGLNTNRSFTSSSFLQHAAAKFKIPEQNEKQALNIIKSIIAPHHVELINFEMFARFMAMFGPPQTVMQKITSLLESSEREKPEPWLLFSKPESMPQNYGMFDENEQNCLFIKMYGTEIKVWNIPLINSNEGDYIMDEDGRLFSSWDTYFKHHPLPKPSNKQLLIIDS